LIDAVTIAASLAWPAISEWQQPDLRRREASVSKVRVAGFGVSLDGFAAGVEAALQRARAAAGSKDVKIGGGVDTVRQYVRAGHVDEIHLAVAPLALGRGEALFDGIDLRALGYRTTQHVPTARATHLVLTK
jgi:dihydrofolate reductase